MLIQTFPVTIVSYPLSRDPLPLLVLQALPIGRRPHVWELGMEQQFRPNTFALTSDGATLLSINTSSNLVVWDVASRSPIKKMPFAKNVQCLATAPATPYMVAAGLKTWRDRVEVWDLRRNSSIGSLSFIFLRGEAKWIGWSSFASGQDSHRLVTVCATGDGDAWSQYICTVWEFDGDRLGTRESRESLREFELQQRGSCWGLSGDGRTLAQGHDNGTLSVWDTGTGLCKVAELGGKERRHMGRVTCCALSSDGTSLVSGSDDKTLRGWELPSGEALGPVLKGHKAPVTCCALAADGRRLISGSYDKTLKEWDLEKWCCVDTLKGGKRCLGVRCCSVPGDGGRVVAGGAGYGDEQVWVWDLE